MKKKVDISLSGDLGQEKEGKQGAGSGAHKYFKIKFSGKELAHCWLIVSPTIGGVRQVSTAPAIVPKLHVASQHNTHRFLFPAHPHVQQIKQRQSIAVKSRMTAICSPSA